MRKYLGKPIEHIVDGENNAVEFDIAYPVKGNLLAAIEQITEIHGDKVYLLPMSGTSTGSGIFQTARPSGTVVGLRFDPPLEARVKLAPLPDLQQLELDEIVIDTQRRQVSAGASITLDQLNQALARELGHQFKVPGADLTSYMYAAVGATFMTGGMGPQRRYFSDSVSQISIFNAHELSKVEGEALQGYAGTYGWSGIVTALSCNYYRFPQNEIAFALPVSGKGRQLVELLDHLSPYCYLNLDSKAVTSTAGNEDLILGIEHVSQGSMLPLLNTGTSPIQKLASELQQKCVTAGADGLIFINAYSDRASDDFLLGLADDLEAEDYTIGGIGLEFAEVFNDPEEMRAIREAIPYAARTQAPDGRLLYKNHTDANIRIPSDEVEHIASQVWVISRDYAARIEDYFAGKPDVECQILVYGHLNPYGMDPHNRVTMSSDDENAFVQSRQFLVDQREEYYRALAALCDSSNAIFVGGEKTADSEMAIYRALGGPQYSPTALFNRFRQQRDTVRAAADIFTWRALQPYSSD